MEAYLRPVSVEDLEQLRQWRNHPSVRAMMFHTHEVGPQEHQQWFSRVSADPNRRLSIFMLDDQPSGFVQFTHDGNQAEWGFHLAPSMQGQGYGLLLGQAALSYAFEQLQLDAVVGKVRSDNQPSLNFHRRLGFTERSQQTQNGNPVYCFRLDRDQWDQPGHGAG